MRRWLSSSMMVLYSNLVVKIGAFLTAVVLARTLEPTAFGALSMALTITTLVFPVLTISVCDSFIVFACKRGVALSRVFLLFAQSLVVGFLGISFGALVGILFLTTSVDVESVLWVEPLVVLLFYLFPLLFITLFLNLFRVYGKNDLYAKYGALAALLLVSVVFITSRFDVLRWVPFAWIVSYGGLALYLLCRVSTHRFISAGVKISLRNLVPEKQFLSYAVSITLGVVASLGSLSVDLLMVGYLDSESAAGIYRVATMVPIALTVIPSSFAAAEFRGIVRSSFSFGDAWRYYAKFVRRFVLVAVALVVIINVFADFALATIFGTQYLGAAPVMRVLSLLIPIYFLLRVPLGSICNAIGLVSLNVKVSYVVFVMAALFCYFAIPLQGVIGAAWSMVAAHGLGGFLSLVLFAKHVRRERLL